MEFYSITVNANHRLVFNKNSGSIYISYIECNHRSTGTLRIRNTKNKGNDIQIYDYKNGSSRLDLIVDHRMEIINHSQQEITIIGKRESNTNNDRNSNSNSVFYKMKKIKDSSNSNEQKQKQQSLLDQYKQRLVIGVNGDEFNALDNQRELDSDDQIEYDKKRKNKSRNRR